jgi:hypothetical protein
MVQNKTTIIIENKRNALTEALEWQKQATLRFSTAVSKSELANEKFSKQQEIDIPENGGAAELQALANAWVQVLSTREELESADSKLQEAEKKVHKAEEDLEEAMQPPKEPLNYKETEISLKNLGLDINTWQDLLALKDNDHKKQYRKLSKTIHPDKKATGHKDFLKLAKAHETLEKHNIDDIKNTYVDHVHTTLEDATGFNFRSADDNTQQVLGDFVLILEELGLHL